jgi:hypothetical protein
MIGGHAYRKLDKYLAKHSLRVSILLASHFLFNFQNASVIYMMYNYNENILVMTKKNDTIWHLPLLVTNSDEPEVREANVDWDN